jgi:N-acetylneuraminic acid mutarotase
MKHASRLRRLIVFAVTPLIAISMFVTINGTAQAATIAHGRTAAVSHRMAAAHRPAAASGRVTARALARAKPAGLAKVKSPPDARAVCQAVKAGHSTCMALQRTNVQAYKGIHPDATPSGYGPPQLQNAYNLPSGSAGNGQTVAIVDAYDDPNAEADLQTYRAQYGLPVCDSSNGCFQKVNENGQTSPLPPPAAGTGWDVEESLDIDMVSAICPQCHIILVEADSNANTDLSTAEDTAVSMGAKFVSNSWGGCEDPSETTDDAYFNHPGVAIAAASGDYGYDNYLEGCDSPSYPAASQYVTSVGGTALTQDSSSPRGWDETTWSPDPQATGSGCSLYEPKPTWQTDTGCTNRMTNDVSAVADPATGVAIYDSYTDGGWAEEGGTSVASPIIASVYALAGTPVAGSYPASYPYQNASALNDVTSGSDYDQSCTPAYFCTAGPGYDGPTGLGTPNGVAAFQGAPSGVLSGKVTSKTGTALAGATVSAGSGYTATTDSSGDYTMTVPDGTYSVTAEAFGYQKLAAAGVTVSQGQTTTQNFALKAVPSQTLSGTITDGSGHAWPLYASITVKGYPGGAVYTNPYTGQYSISLPQNHSYSLTVNPVYPGYNTATASVRVGLASKTRNFKVTVAANTCDAPGYGFTYNGTSQDFTGWSGTTAQDGWTNVDNEGNGDVWRFGTDPAPDPNGSGPPAGSTGEYADVDSYYYGWGTKEDTSLVSPVVNLSKQTSPEISFDTWYQEWPSGQTANVDLSLDGGQTWSTVYTFGNVGPTDGPVTIPIPQAAGHADVQVRFHYSNNGYGWWWELDNIFIGTQKCSATPGGLVAGTVTDNNTGDALNGATVTNDTTAGQSGASAANPADPSLANGFYWLFASPPGSDQFTASDGSYTSSTQTVTVARNAVTHQNWPLQAGNLSVSAGSLSVTQTLGAARTKEVKLTDTGTEPVQVQLNPQSSGYTPMGVKPGDKAALKGAPVQKVRGHFSPVASVQHKAKATSKATSKTKPTSKAKVSGPASGLRLRPAAPSDTPWASIANYPESIMENAVGYDTSTGNVYSAGGYNGSGDVADAYVYSGSTQAWSAITPLPQALEAAGGAFLNGKMYVVGGWDTNGDALSTLYAYDPSSQTWNQEANLPQGLSGAAVATLNGQLYVVGGCTTGACSPTSDAAYRYDPGSNSWTQLASYPTAAAFAGCAGTGGQLVCAGGDDADTGATLTSTYIYDPSSNSWSQGASMPYDDWGMVYGGSGGQLQIADGVTNDSTEATNQVIEYDPSSNSWSTLPNANNAEALGGGSCGMYQIGGGSTPSTPTPNAEVLPGYNQCGTENIPWLSTSSSKFTLNPGQSQTVAVTMDSSAVSQPGSYTAQLGVETNTPYQFQPISITMQANPPSTWSKVMGTVTDASTGNPIAGATIQICTQYDKSTGTCGAVSYTLTTGSNGNYQLWLNRGYNPLQIVAALDGYQPATKLTKLIAGVPDTVNFALNKAG